MTGLPERRKSVTASRTSCTLPQSAPAPDGFRITLVIRLSVLAFLSISTTARTVGGPSMNDPNTPPASISPRLPPTRSTSVELLVTCGSRPTALIEDQHAHRRDRHGDSNEDDDDPDTPANSHPSSVARRPVRLYSGAEDP